jgi:hypothetical protein
VAQGHGGHLHKNILHKGGMFTKEPGSGRSPSDLLEDFLKSIHWPYNTGRLNVKIASGSGRYKADEWRNLMSVYVVGLAVAWNLWEKSRNASAPNAKAGTNLAKDAAKRDALLQQRRAKLAARGDDSTSASSDAEDLDSESDPQSQSRPPSRNYWAHYTNCLRFCASLRILATRALSLDDVDRGLGFHLEAFRSWARMGCHLTPNFHGSVHLGDYLRAYGPMYGWWAWAYERFNGILARVKTNGHHSGGELEATLMRAWVKTSLTQDLVSLLLLLMHLLTSSFISFGTCSHKLSKPRATKLLSSFLWMP